MNENHKRALASSLRVVERYLRTIHEDLIQGKDLDRTLYRKVNNIDGETRREILGIVTSMLDEIGQIKEKFSLKTKEEPIRREVNSLFGDVWVILQELRPKGLDDYGKMPEIDKALLSPHVAALEEMVKRAQDCMT